MGDDSIHQFTKLLDDRAPESMRDNYDKLCTEILRLRAVAESADTELRDEVREMRQYAEKLAQEDGMMIGELAGTVKKVQADVGDLQMDLQKASEQILSNTNHGAALSKAANEQASVLTGLEKTSAMLVEQVRANKDWLRKLDAGLSAMEKSLQVLTNDSRSVMREHKGAIEGLEHSVGVLAEDMKANMDTMSAMILERQGSMDQIKKWIEANGDQMGKMVHDMDASHTEMNSRLAELEKAVSALGQMATNEDLKNAVEDLHVAVQQQAKGLLDTIEFVNSVHGRLKGGVLGLAEQERSDANVLFQEVDALRQTETRHAEKLQAGLVQMKEAMKREEWHADQLEARLENTEDCCKMLEALLQGISQQQGIIDNAPADAAVNAETAAEARDAADRAHSAADQAARAAAKSDALSAEIDELRALVDKKNRAGDASATSHLPKRVQLLEEEDLRILKRLEELEKRPSRPRSRDVAVQHNVVSGKSQMPGADAAKAYIDPITGRTTRYISTESANGTNTGATYRPVVEPVHKKVEATWYSQLIGTQ